ncbi:oxysterol binding protein [Cyathus striatus]|nr:oxysterol binding protein [Cyathus striatus]
MRSSKPPAQSLVGASLNVAALVTTPAAHDAEIICQGWVLKKRRKKMQGFARRYFVLYQSGVLAYSFQPGHPVRDQVHVQHAAISTAPGRKDIHVDSNTATFHIKCLSAADFNTWMSAFRKFIAVGEARKSATLRLASRQGSLSLSRSGVIVEEMGATLAELDEVVTSLAQDAIHKKHCSSGSKKTEKEKSKEHAKFSLFKRPLSHHHFSQEPSSDASSEFTTSENLSTTLQQIKVSLEVLKSQHASLAKAIQGLAIDSAHSAHSFPLPSTAEEEKVYENVSPRIHSPIVRKADRMSIATTSDASEWFDAVEFEDGPEEFVMDAHNTLDGPESFGRFPTNDDSRSSIDNSDASSVDTDLEEDVGVPTTLTGETSGKVIRRTALPSAPPGDEGSLFTILKKNVGKDLSTITFPVSFNEPLTLLQRAAEEVEYFDLLEQAAKATDPVERISYVAAFAVSGYAHTRHRSGRKGFNPMLAETFEDPRMKFIAEKVRHNPLEIAYHAEGPNWELTATTHGKTKFWGKSLEIIPMGSNRLRVGSDYYTWKKPSSFMRNLMVGTKYFEHTGQMIIDNTSSHIRCVLDFKQNGYWGPSNVISGLIQSSEGDVLCQLEGKWDDQVSQTVDLSHFRVLWRMAPFPKDTHQYYGFTAFAVTLNEMTLDLGGKLPPTDSQNGDLDLAEDQKRRVEELQRERRRQGQDRQPKWFKQVGDEWEYSGGYWEARSRSWRDEDISALW